jgi:hypothetical protein
MTRRGRKRKAGRRQPNGQPARDRAFVREDVLSVVRRQPHRRRYGEAFNDERAECELGRLCLEKFITESMYQAGVRYRRDAIAMRRALDAPTPDPKGMDLQRAGKGHDGEETKDQAKRAIEARSKYADAFSALKDAGGYAVYSVNDIVLWDRHRSDMRGSVSHLCAGLRLLMKHYGIVDQDDRRTA